MSRRGATSDITMYEQNLLKRIVEEGVSCIQPNPKRSRVSDRPEPEYLLNPHSGLGHLTRELVARRRQPEAYFALNPRKVAEIVDMARARLSHTRSQ